MTAESNLQPAPGQHRHIVIYCGFLLSISAFSVDITLPLFSQIASDLDVPIAGLAATVTIYIGCMGLGQLFFGPFSDRFGRKPALLLGLGVFLAGVILAVVAPSFSVLLLARAIQGLGGGVAPVVARAILRDLFQGRELARAMAVATGIFSIGPIVGPLLGGLLGQLGSSWRSVFIGMLIYVSLLLLALRRVPETLVLRQSDALELPVLLRNARSVLGHPQSRFFLLVGMIMLTSMLLILSVSPPIYREQFGISGIAFAILFASHGFGIIIGQILNHRLIGKIGEIPTAICAASVTTAATLLIVLFSAMQWLTVYWLTFFIFIFAIGFLAIASNSISMALGPHGNIAGFASSLQGAMSQIGAGIFASSLAALIPLNSFWWGLTLLSISLVVMLLLTSWQCRH